VFAHSPCARLVLPARARR